MVPLCNWQARELVFKLLSRLLDVSFLLALIISPLSGVLRDAERYFETISFILQTHQCKSGGGGGGGNEGGGDWAIGLLIINVFTKTSQSFFKAEFILAYFHLAWVDFSLT